jgi:hypothetical protein
MPASPATPRFEPARAPHRAPDHAPDPALRPALRHALRHAPHTALALTLVGAPALAAAQAAPPPQVVRGPIATYWLTADTTSGLGAMGGGGIGGMLGMLAGRAPAAVRTLDLRLGSSQSPTGAPQASHRIPPGMAMGESLPLVTPEPVAAPRAEPAERTLPEGVEQPKGRMLIYWGCGEKAGPGQPVVIDFSKIGPGQPMPDLVSRNVNVPRGPAFGVSRTYGGWPNERDRQQVPAQSSLRGEHRVTGSYTPDIRFVVERQDFMPPVALVQGKTASGAQQLTWTALEGATGYFMTAFGAGAGSGGATDMVLWSSSAVQEMGGSLTGHVPPAEVARMIRERVVLPPDRTECMLPAEVSAAMPAGMLNFIAYGDEMNVVYPPRPADPKQPWDRQYAVKLRLRSTSMLPLGEGLGAMMGGRGTPAAGGAPAATGGAPAATGGAPPAAGDATAAPAAGQPPAPAPAPAAGGLPTEAVEQGVREGVRVLRGIFGR